MPKPAPLFYEMSAVPELGAFMASAPWLAAAPRGHGRRILVIPGFTAGDLTTAPLRGVLRMLGHRPAGWGLGANIGPDDNTVRQLMRRVDELVERNGGPIDLVGWSLGGIMSRLIALYRPGDVRQVVSMGSPIRVKDPEAVLDFASQRLADGRFTEEQARQYVENAGLSPHLLPLPAANPSPLPEPPIGSTNGGFVRPGGTSVPITLDLRERLAKMQQGLIDGATTEEEVERVLRALGIDPDALE